MPIYEIYRASRNDEGIYKCVGINDAGTAEELVQVLVDSLPTRGDITGNYV